MSFKRKLRAHIAGADKTEAAAALTAAGCEIVNGVLASDFVVRMPGESVESDADVATAYRGAVPVFHTLNSALLYVEHASQIYADPKGGAE